MAGRVTSPHAEVLWERGLVPSHRTREAVSEDPSSALIGTKKKGALSVRVHLLKNRQHDGHAKVNAGGIAEVQQCPRNSAISATMGHPKGFVRCESNITHGPPRAVVYP